MLKLLLNAVTLVSLAAAHGHTTESPVTQLLKGAIKRGVPMYNNGWHQSCALVYETALHAVILGDWGMTEAEVDDLKSGFEDAMTKTKWSEKAWAYRYLMNGILNSQKNMDMMEKEAPDGSDDSSDERTPTNKKVLFDFKKDSASEDWTVIVDGVMGGLSTGNVQTRNGKMLFYGETSLANNGGFSSIRAELAPGALTGMDTLKMRVRGDGREYILGVRGSGSYSFWTRFQTEEGEWMIVDAPINKMEKHWFGMKRPGQIKPSEVRAVELYVNDKRAGPFKLKVDFIKAMEQDVDSSN